MDFKFEPERKSHIDIGKIYFWTATINQWQRLLHEDRYKQVVVDSLNNLSLRGKIDVFAFVIMPNHIHLIWRINEANGKELPHSSLLKFTSHEFKKMLKGDGIDLITYKVEAENKNYEFWKRDSLAIELYTQEMAYQKLDYIHLNPLAEKWSLAADPCDYKYSSALFYERGIRNFSILKDLKEEF